MSLVMGLCGVVLAAGESTRMGRDKALLPWPPGGAGTLLSAAIDVLNEYCELVIVVAGKNEPALQAIAYGCGALLVRNPAPERGQFSSVQTGLREVLNRGRDAAMITLVDRPPPQRTTLATLVSSFASRDHGVWAVIPEHGGKHGHPILVGREMIETFLRAPATANARDIEHENQQRITYLSVDDSLVTTNVDTAEEFAALESGFNRLPKNTP
jgi:molybdenum cofactor cytidylyltransferase